MWSGRRSIASARTRFQPSVYPADLRAILPNSRSKSDANGCRQGSACKFSRIRPLCRVLRKYLQLKVEVEIRDSLSSRSFISIRFRLRCRLRTNGVSETDLLGCDINAENAVLSKINDVHQAVVIRVTRIPHIQFSDAAIGISILEGLLTGSSADPQTDQPQSLRCWR
jgi:hypothetical protein